MTGCSIGVRLGVTGSIGVLVALRRICGFNVVVEIEIVSSRTSSGGREWNGASGKVSAEGDTD